VRLGEVGGGRVAAVLARHPGPVAGLTVRGGGRLARGSVAAGRTGGGVGPGAGAAAGRGLSASVGALAVLADGRLASGSHDGMVRLWDVMGGRSCVGVLSPGSHAGAVLTLAALPDGRLAAGTGDGGIWLCDTSTAAAAGAAASSRAVGAVFIAALGRVVGPIRRLVALPDGRVASAQFSDIVVRLWEVPPPAA